MDRDITVRMSISEAEAARQLEGGKPIRVSDVNGTDPLFVIPNTGNKDVDRWTFSIYDEKGGQPFALIDTKGDVRSAIEFVMRRA